MSANDLFIMTIGGVLICGIFVSLAGQRRLNRSVAAVVSSAVSSITVIAMITIPSRGTFWTTMPWTRAVAIIALIGALGTAMSLVSISLSREAHDIDMRRRRNRQSSAAPKAPE